MKTAESETLLLNNESKVRFCNAYLAMRKHLSNCYICAICVQDGDGDLCVKGKWIIAREMAYADMGIELPPTKNK